LLAALDARRGTLWLIVVVLAAGVVALHFADVSPAPRPMSVIYRIAG